MRAVYTFHERHALPAIASLLLTMALIMPVEQALLPHALHHARNAQLIDLAIRLAIFVWLFAVTRALWRQWLSRRPTLVPLPRSGTIGRKTVESVEADTRRKTSC